MKGAHLDRDTLACGAVRCGAVRRAVGSVPVGHGACVQVVLGSEMRVRPRRVAVCTGGGDRACDGTRMSGCSGEGGRRWMAGG